MRHFLSPAEQALLDGVTNSEREVIRALFDELDARLVEDGPVPWMWKGSAKPSRWWTDTKGEAA